MGKVELIPLKTRALKAGDDLVGVLLESAGRAGGLKEGDVLVVSCKAVSICRGHLVRLDSVRPSRRARRLSKPTGLDARMVEVILREAEKVLGGVRYALLTLRDRMLLINAGVDMSNAPPGHVAVLPPDPQRAARELREEVSKRAGVQVAVVLSDSVTHLLRKGTTGIAVGWSGLQPVEDCRGKEDLFGRKLKVTFRAVADQLAAAAQLLMGESGEGVPCVVVRGLDLSFKGGGSPVLPPKKCVFSPILKRSVLP